MHLSAAAENTCSAPKNLIKAFLTWKVLSSSPGSYSGTSWGCFLQEILLIALMVKAVCGLGQCLSLKLLVPISSVARHGLFCPKGRSSAASPLE